MNRKKIVFVGGGTAGSVMPLVAVFQRMQKQFSESYSFLFLGTKKGIEKEIAKENDIPYSTVLSGKLRRYFDIRNIIDPFKVIIGVLQSLYILGKYKPHIILSAGSFVATPVIWAAWILRIPIIIHQLDIERGLSNALTAPCATHITVALKELKELFPRYKTTWTGNPVRESLFNVDRQKAIEHFNLRRDLPVLLVLGGGTGALELNKIVESIRKKLSSLVQIIHITGKNKKIVDSEPGYLAFTFLGDELKYAYAASDIVLSRAGMSTISELALLKKPMVLVPLPNSHQLNNADFFRKKEACQVINQDNLNEKSITSDIKKYLIDTEYKRAVTQNMAGLFRADSLECYIELIQRTINDSQK